MHNTLEKYRHEMIAFLQNKYGKEGEIQSDIEALDFYFVNQPTELTSIMYEPSLCVIFQGEKEVDFGDQSFFYNPKGYLLASTHVPAKIKVLKATPNEPYMSLRIKFTLKDIYEVLKHNQQRKCVSNTQIEKGLFLRRWM